jgi:hypothetical protein
MKEQLLLMAKTLVYRHSAILAGQDVLVSESQKRELEREAYKELLDAYELGQLDPLAKFEPIDHLESETTEMFE